MVTQRLRRTRVILYFGNSVKPRPLSCSSDWMDRYVTVSDVLRKSNLVQLRFEILDRLELNALRARRSARDHPRNERGACRGVGEIEPIALSEQVESDLVFRLRA